MSNAALLVSIPGCEASQVLGSAESALGEGTLVAFAAPASPQTILIQVGKAAFELGKDDRSSFFTHADDERLYFFSADHLGSGSYVKLTLPADVSQPHSTTRKLRDQFEDALLARGFLRGGALAAADELGRSIAQDGRANAAAVSRTSKEHIRTTSKGHVDIPEGVRDAAIQAKDVSATGAEKIGYVAAKATEAVQNAGARAAEAMPSVDLGGEESVLSSVSEGAKTTWTSVQEGASSIGEGIAEGANELGSSVSTAAHDVIDHSYGSEASRTADDVGQAGRNTGKAFVDVGTTASTVYHGAQFGRGAAAASSSKE